MNRLRKFCGSSGHLTGLIACAALLGGCGGDGDSSVVEASSGPDTTLSESTVAAEVLENVRTQFSVTVPPSESDVEHSLSGGNIWKPPFEASSRVAIQLIDDSLAPRVSADATADVLMPTRATGAFSVADRRSGMRLHARLRGALDVSAEYGSGAVVYRQGHEQGDVILRPTEDGVEDYVVVRDAAVSHVEYDVDLVNVAGVRLVDGTFELLDATGDPRLRAAPPYVVDAAGQMRMANLSVSGCAVDTDPRAPWGRAVTPPESSSCQLTVSWVADGLQSPLLVDPSWSTTGSMTIGRRGHVLSGPSTTTGQTNGLVLVAGGQNGSTILTTAELYNPATGTWAATASMSTGHAYGVGINHSQTVSGINDDRVLVAGGYNALSPSTTITSTAQRYRFKTATWEAVPSMAVQRVSPAFDSVDLNKVIVQGGGSSASTAQFNAQIYDFSNNTWTTLPLPTYARRNATATRLSSAFGPAEVLFAGGLDSNGVVAACQKYNPTNNLWVNAGTLPNAVYRHTAALCAGCPTGSNGKVFVAGGYSAAGGATNAIQGYDPTTNSWSAAGTMSQALTTQASQLVTLTGDTANRILFMGGANATDQSTNFVMAWPSGGPATSSMQIARSMWFRVTRLANAKLLVSGGYNSQGPSTLAAAELFTP
jgi:hypothetical protein